MNGRIFDYNVGRFLGVDPVFQFPTNSQSANPYSYILNNPMAGTDPTGYSVENSLLPEIAAIIPDCAGSADKTCRARKVITAGDKNDDKKAKGGKTHLDVNEKEEENDDTSENQSENNSSQVIYTAQKASGVLEESKVVMQTQKNLALPFDSPANTWELQIEPASTKSKMILLDGKLLVKKLFLIGIGAEVKEFIDSKDNFSKTMLDLGANFAPFINPTTTIPAGVYLFTETFYPGGSKELITDFHRGIRQGLKETLSPITTPLINFERQVPYQQESTLKRTFGLPEFNFGDNK